MTSRVIRRIAPPATALRRIAPTWVDEAPEVVDGASLLLASPAPAHYRSSDLATGRGLTYEWELVAADVLDRIDLLEQGASPPLRYVYTQSAPAATWIITHNLGTDPVVTVVASDGSELIAELQYLDTNNVSIVFGQPYAGTAYLRG